MLLFIVIATEKLSKIYTANINAPAYIVQEAAPMVREYAAVRRNRTNEVHDNLCNSPIYRG